jgi:uncharacterized protein (DUF2236 family)
MRPGFCRFLIATTMVLVVGALVVGQQRRARVRQTVERVHQRIAEQNKPQP